MGQESWGQSAHHPPSPSAGCLPHAEITVKEGSATPEGSGTCCPKEAPVLLLSIFGSLWGSDQTGQSSVRYCRKSKSWNGSGEQLEQVAFYCFCCCARQLPAYLKPAVQNQNKRKQCRTISSGSLTPSSIQFFFFMQLQTKEIPCSPIQEDLLSASCCTNMLRRCFPNSILHTNMTANQS